MPIRPCNDALATALAGGVKLWEADLFRFTLADGVTNYYWTSYDSDIIVGDVTYSSRAPWLSASKWSVTNTMEVPSMTVQMLALNASFAGGPSIKAQAHNGLFDGASFLFSMGFMTTPGAVAALGSVDIFGGVTGAVDIIGSAVTVTCRGKNNLLDQYVPRNVYQVGCNHAFCDSGCTLNRATYTTSYTAGAGADVSFVPWSGAHPSNYANYVNGTVAFTSGTAAGQRRTVQAASTTGLTLIYPLLGAPAAGDGFTAFEGCDKTQASGSGQSCSARGNEQHYRGFPFVPPPNTSW